MRTLREAHGPLAQLDRASGYGPEGRGFESLKVRHRGRSKRIERPLLLQKLPLNPENLSLFARKQPLYLK